MMQQPTSIQKHVDYDVFEIITLSICMPIKKPTHDSQLQQPEKQIHRL